MQVSAIKFERFQHSADEECQQRIIAAREKLGKRLVILGHHYQQDGVYKHADYTGDSLKLSRQASQVDAEYIVFLGVHFMAEVADILSRPDQIVMLPPRCWNGRSRDARRCCSSPTRTWAAGPATRWAFRSSRCRYGIQTNRWAA